MSFHPEIKEFTKNTLILTLFFTLVLHLSWGYIGPYLGLGANANSSNDATFQQANTLYIGNIATAVSLNIGQKQKQTDGTPIGINNDIVSVAEALSSPNTSWKKLIASNMIYLQSYVNVLKTDIVWLLDQSTDRTKTLDEHIELLKSYYIKTTERNATINEQIADLKSILASATSSIENAKKEMDIQYRNFEYAGVDSVIANYVTAKHNESQANVYLTYLQRFQKGYAILQWKNKVILDTLINNHEAIVKRATVVIPDSGDTMLKDLWLIQSESDFKTSNK